MCTIITFRIEHYLSHVTSYSLKKVGDVHSFKRGNEDEITLRELGF